MPIVNTQDFTVFKRGIFAAPTKKLEEPAGVQFDGILPARNCTIQE
jgi:hypothetical protein